MRRVVLESPYAGDIEANVKYAKRCMRDCLSRGESPIASHLLWTQEGLLDDGDHRERAIGIAAGHSWTVAAEAVVVYVDRGVSAGMKAGVREALAHGIPVEHRSLEGLVDGGAL